MQTVLSATFLINNFFVLLYYIESFIFNASLPEKTKGKESCIISQHIAYKMELSSCFHLMTLGLRE